MLSLVLGMALRLYDLDADSLWVDEILTLTTAQRDIPSLLDFQARASVHPPLLYMLTRLFLLLAGDSDFVLRLQAVLFGSLSILLTYKVGELLWTKTEGAIGAFLLAVNVYHVQYSQEARHYALMIFLALLSLIFLLKALQQNQKRLWLSFFLCTTLGLYNHYFAFLFLPAEVIFATWVIAENWLARRERGTDAIQVRQPDRLSIPATQALSLVASVGLIGVSYLPWLPLMLQQMSGRRIRFGGFVASTAPRVVMLADFLRELLVAYSGAAGGAALLFLILLILGLASCKGKHISLIGSWFALPVLFTCLVRTEHFTDPRYTVFILPIFVLTMARGVRFVTGSLGHRLRSGAGDEKWPVLASSTLAVVVFGSLSVAPLRHYYAAKKPDWRYAARYLEATAQPGDIVLADGEGVGGKDYYRVEDGLSTYLSRWGTAWIPILPVKRGLADAMAQNLGDGLGKVSAVIYHKEPLFTTRVEKESTVVDLEDVAIIELREPSGRLLRDATSMLGLLVDFLPASEARFDVHVALAEIYLRTGDFEQAEVQLNKASQAKPDTLKAARRLARACDAFEHVSPAPDEDIQHPVWRSLGLLMALRGYEVGSESVRRGSVSDVTLWWQAVGNMDRDYSAFIHLVGPGEHIWTQEDRLLQDGDDPTSAWEVGDIVRERYRLQLPADIPSGEYVVQAGIYYWETGERLVVWNEDGQRLAQDAMTLGSISVVD